MPTVGQFGPLADSIAPIKGPPFNLHLGTKLVPAGGFDLTFTFSNTGVDPMWINGLDIESPQACIVVLKIDGAIRWRGRVGWSKPAKESRWHDAEFLLPTGKSGVVEVCHFETSAVEMSANIMGFTR